MINEEQVLEMLNHGVNSFKLLSRVLKVNKQELMAFLDSLVTSDKAFYDRHFDSFYLLKPAKLDIKEGGYGFASVEGEQDDYFVPAMYIPNNTYTGDVALIYPYEKGTKLINAGVYKIIERGHKFVIGILKESLRKKGPKYHIESSMLSFPVSVIVDAIFLNGAKPGDSVKANLNYSGDKIYGHITEIIGNKNDPGIEITEIALEYGFKKDFSAETVDELAFIPDSLTEADYKGRRDFRNNTVITIDGDDSKDFDDAVFAAKESDHYHLEVYIADVANYVKENSALDKDAYSRGTSLYLADRVIPMLPQKLSNGICSLNEGEDRLVLAVLMDIDFKGNLINYEITEGVIKSCHRMTYNKVNKILNNDIELCKEYSDIKDMLFTMLELSELIRERRYKKGGIEFETDEYHYILNEDGSPKDVELRTRGKGEMLIEDFMLQANETIAYHMSIMNMPCVYRVHEKPDQEKLHNVFNMITNMGVQVKKTQNDIHPKQIQDALEKINDSAYKPIINNLLLRNMMKAKYHEQCLGHYGLAMNYYCHFTSPIRRYPDLMVHRLIKNLLLHSNNPDEDLLKYEHIVPEVAMLTSNSEKRSVDCERAVDDMLAAWYMTNFKNVKLSGIITSVTSFGMFVTLENGIEGLINYRDMIGFFDYNSNTMTASNGAITYHLGDRVDVVCINASKKQRKIDFMLYDDYEEEC